MREDVVLDVRAKSHALAAGPFECLVVGFPPPEGGVDRSEERTHAVIAARWLLVQAAQHLGQYRGPLGQTMRRIVQRKNRKVAVVACARKLAVLLWHVLSSGEPFRYAPPKSLQAKFSRLRVRATGRRRKGGVPRGTPRSAQYGHGRTRALPSLPQVLVENGLPEIAPLSQGETLMLEKKKLHAFYRELQVPCRVEAATGSPQVKESEENAKA